MTCREYPIFSAPLGTYQVVGALAQPPGLRVGDTIRLEEIGGKVYRTNLTCGESVLLEYTAPHVWVQ